MRRYALLGSIPPVPLLLACILPLSGCASFGDFLGNTSTYNTNPNLPVGQSETLRRVQGLDTDVEPLSPEAGNVWPTDIQSAPTLQDLERETNQGSTPAPPPDLTPYLPGQRQPRVAPGSSSPEILSQPGLAPSPNAGVQPAPPVVGRSNATPPNTVVQTPSGPGVSSDAGGVGGYRTLTTPQGNAIVIPNGNGTSTVVKPDGTVQTIQTPK